MNDKEAVIAGLRNMARDRQYKNHRQGRTGGFFGGVLNPDPTVNLRPGRIWVREGADGSRAQSEALIVGVVDTVADIPVWLAETVEGGELCVLGPVVTTRNLESWGGGLPSTGVPRQPSALSTSYVKSDNILTGRIGASTSHPASLYVTIQPFWAFGKQLGDVEHDVGAANVPGSANEHRWCMICVDVNNDTYTLTGTEYVRTSANELLLDTTDVDITIPAGYVPVGLVSLSYGQTDISESRFVDARHWIAPVVTTPALSVDVTEVGNVGTGEDNLISYTVPADTLVRNKDRLIFEAAVVLANNANAKQVKVKFGSTTLFDTGALPTSAAIDLVIRGTIIREGTAVQKVGVQMTTSSSSQYAGANYAGVTEDLTTALALKLTGEATSNNDIICEYLTVDYLPAP